MISGIDVAGNLETMSSINSETCSLGSVMSLHSHGSGIGQMLNEDEALKIILAKHSMDQNSSQSSNPPTEERTSDTSDVEIRSSDSENINPLEVSLGNSLNKRTGWSFDEKELTNEEMLTSPATENMTIEEAKSMEHSYNSLIASYNLLGSSTIKTPVLKDIWQKFENNHKEIKNENSIVSLKFMIPNRLLIMFAFRII